MDGSWTLQQIWDEACVALGDLMPTQQEVIDLVSQLHQANAIQSEGAVDTAEIYTRRRKIKRDKLVKKLMSPFGLRVPLWDPEPFLKKTERFATPIYGRLGFAIWAAVVLLGVVLAVVHARELFNNIADQALALENVVALALIYPVLKVIHELGHAYAVKRWGGEVREIGVMFLIFYPVPYTDASAASSFPDKRHRMIVGAAGIMVELFLAALAMFVWVNVEPGPVHAIAANVILLAGVSAPLFNGNPLLRFDAYYVLADFIEVPNLGQKGASQIGYLVKRHILGIRSATSPAWSQREGFWLGSYAVLSFLYRLLILFAITLAVTSRYFFIGSLIAIWAFYMTLIGPAIKMARAPLIDGGMRAMKGRVFAVGGGAVAAILAFLFLIPMPLSTKVEGLVWVEDKAIVRAGDSGFVTQLIVRPGSQVAPGQPLIALDNPTAKARLASLNIQHAYAEQALQAAFDTPGQALIEEGNLRFLRTEMDIARDRAEGLVPRSAVHGTFLMSDPADAIGRYFKRGQRIGYIAAPDHMLVVLLVPDDEIDPVRQSGTRTFLRFLSERGRTVEGRIVRITPSPDNLLPSEILSTAGGGPYAPDPRAKDNLRSFNRFYRVDVAVSDIGRHHVEERVHGLFRHNWEPLGHRWVRALRRLFLGGPAGS